MKKMEYRQPTADLILYQNEDIITTSLEGGKLEGWWQLFNWDFCPVSTSSVDISEDQWVAGMGPGANVGWREWDSSRNDWNYWTCSDWNHMDK